MEKEIESGEKKGIKESLQNFIQQVVRKFGKEIKAMWAVIHQREILLVILVNDIGKERSKIERLIEKIKLYALKLEEKLKAEIKTSISTDVVLLTEYYEKLLENRLDIFAEVKQAIPLYDTGFFIPIKILVERGEIKGTKESIVKLVDGIRKNLNEVDYLKVDILSDIYSSVIDAAEAALFSRGISFFVPKEIPGLLEKYFLKEKQITKNTLDIFNAIYRLWKDYEHEKIKIEGKKLDKLIIDAEFFVDQMQQITRKWIKA